jgi:RNA-splicing ligase RtcB
LAYSPDWKNVHARGVYADAEMIKDLGHEEALKQVMTAAYLSGILTYSLAMPDVHWSYGFPIDGVAAPDGDEGSSRLEAPPTTSTEGSDCWAHGGYGLRRELRLGESANNHLLNHYVFQQVFGVAAYSLRLMDDVCHNIAEREKHDVNGEGTLGVCTPQGYDVCPPPHHPHVPETYREVGQPMLIPEDMGGAHTSWRAPSELWKRPGARPVMVLAAS